MEHPRRANWIAVMAIGLAIACGPSTATATASRTASASAPPRSAAPIDATPLTAPVRGLVGAFDGTAGVVIAFPGEPAPVYAANADTPFIAASLYKLAVLAHIERLVDGGTLTYDDTITIEDADVTIDGSNEPAGTSLTIDEALEEMITYSDNGSALALLRVYGAVATNADLAAAGIKGFHVAENSDEDHMVTPRAVATFFDRLATRQLVSPAASDRMLARLERQTINDRLPRDLPQGVLVAHKTGDLVGFIHDAGVIEASDGPRIAVVLTSGGTEDDARALIARIGALVYSAALVRPSAAAAQVAPLPSPQTFWSRFGTGAAAAVVAIIVIVLAWFLAARRSARRRARRAAGPMTVWSPDRRRPR